MTTPGADEEGCNAANPRLGRVPGVAKMLFGCSVFIVRRRLHATTALMRVDIQELFFCLYEARYEENFTHLENDVL